jgi:F-type H+-transporting ATPase subunit gamma
MSDTLVSLRHKLNGARQLGSVVRAMKAVAATSISQYEGAVLALGDYAHGVELGLSLCLSAAGEAQSEAPPSQPVGIHGRPTTALIFGSDQGLVGRFNEVISDFAVHQLEQFPGPKLLWVVGERVAAQLEATGLPIRRQFAVPNSVAAITSLVSDIQLEIEGYTVGRQCPVYVFHNQPRAAPRYEPSGQCLLPLDAAWRSRLGRIEWPGKALAEILGSGPASLPALVHEHLFICLFKACAESLASENASRLEAMQRAEKNIDEVSAKLHTSLNRLRQSSIDGELFDVVAGFNAVQSRERVGSE